MDMRHTILLGKLSCRHGLKAKAKGGCSLPSEDTAGTEFLTEMGIGDGFEDVS